MVPVLGYSYVINRREGRCNFNNYICDQGYICTEFNYCILESKAAGVQPCPNHRDHELSGLIEQGKIRPGSAGGQHGCNEEDGSCTIYECEEEYYHYSRTETHPSRPNPKKCHGRSTPTTTTKQRSSHYSSTRATQHRPAGNYGSPQQGSSYECIECEKYKNTKITRGSTPSHTPTSHQPQSHHDSSYECVECEKYKHTKTTKVTTPTHRPNSKRPQSHHSGSYECTECEEYQNTKITRGSTPSHTPNPQQPRTSQRGHSQTSQHGVFSQSTTITKTEYKKYCMGDQECMTCMTQYSVKVEMQVECIMGAYSRVKQPRRTNGLVNTIKNFAQDVYSLFNRYRNDYSASRVLNAFDKQIAKKNQRIQKLEHDNSRKGDLSDMRKQELSELVDSRNLFKSSRDQFDHLSRTV
ncbi:hypothetical protein H4R35_003880 [Dimargaris xerosporica]|nr:hypothetical protein H4R35_003880 [Dimargaris xerosporica]